MMIKLNTAFMIIQQVTKSGTFAGSNKLKHMVTSMGHMKMSDEGRYLHFSKNRRGGNGNKLFFKDSPDDFISFEVAIFGEDGEFTREFFPKSHADEVLKRQDRGQINALMLLIQSKNI
jgi:hypothetical protein